MNTLNEKVIQLILEKTGLEFRQSKDYALAALMITEKTGECFSDNTLRRLMGVKSDGGTPRLSTLDILARYLDYENWDSLSMALHLTEPEPESSFIFNVNEVLSSSLPLGQRIKLQYPPQRILRIEYLGNDVFEVLECSSSNLRVGDHLTIHNIVEGQMLYVWKVERDGQDLGRYCAAEVGGVEKISIE